MLCLHTAFGSFSVWTSLLKRLLVIPLLVVVVVFVLVLVFLLVLVVVVVAGKATQTS
jgi:hypothetical protein